jgi:lysophospholipase L1-like esterase
MATHLRFATPLLMFCIGSAAQLAPQIAPQPGECCLPMRVSQLLQKPDAELRPALEKLQPALEDWNQFGRYTSDDQRLRAQSESDRVVFMGDSITDGWKLDQYFPGKPYVNRGISGQTTEQMLTRFFQDVIDLEPAAVIILAGTNDIARNTGPETLEILTENLQAMSELARAHHIRVVLCSLTPISDYTQHPQTAHRPPADILRVNEWIRGYARRGKTGFADYYSVTVDDKGMLRQGNSEDGLHPNAQGYALMAPVAEKAIERALRKR